MRAVTMLLLLILPYQKSEELTLPMIRKLYLASVTNKETAQAFSKSLQDIDGPAADPVFLCYRGVADLMEAKFLINPFSKFDKFKSGKNRIEEAERRDTTAVEIRYLRFAVQTNLPAILGYNSNINQDKTYLLNNFNNISDEGT